jgi:transcription elongation factor Elf1
VETEEWSRYVNAMYEHRELCTKCGKVTANEVIQHAAGTEFVCKVCGTQTDFLHNEEETQ